MTTTSAYPLKSVKPLAGYKIWAEFSDGTEGEVDLTCLTEIPYLSKLKDLKVFASVRLDDGGSALKWGADEEELDASWETVYEQLTGKSYKEALPDIEPIVVVAINWNIIPDVRIKFSDGTQGEVRLTNISYEPADTEDIKEPHTLFVTDAGGVIWGNKEFYTDEIYELLTPEVS